MAKRVRSAAGPPSGSAEDEDVEEEAAEQAPPVTRLQLAGKFLLDQFLPLGLLAAMTVGCALSYIQTPARNLSLSIPSNAPFRLMLQCLWQASVGTACSLVSPEVMGYGESESAHMVVRISYM